VPESSRRRVVLSEDLPLTLLTAVATTLVLNVVGLGKQLLYLGVVLSPLVADVIKNAFRGLRRRWLLLLTALLALLGTGGRAVAARLRAAQQAVVDWPAVAVTAGLSAVLTVALFTAPELARGKAILADRSTTFFGPSSPAVPVPPDVVPPRISVPADLVVRAHGPLAVRYRASARDLVDGRLAPVCRPRSGAVFAVGTTAVRCSVADAHGNRTAASFRVTVRRIASPISLVLPTTISLEAAGPAGARAFFSPPAHDARGRPLDPRCSPPSGSLFPIGTTYVSCAAADRDGSRTSGRFPVAVRDGLAPELALPPPVAVVATGAAGRRVTFDVTARDRVDGAVPATCRPATGSLFPVGATTVTCTAMDAHGNRASATLAVAVRPPQPTPTPKPVPVDTVPPVLTVPTGERVEATSAAGAVVPYRASARDEVDGAVEPVCAPAAGTTFPFGDTTVRCSSRDAAGNAAGATFLVTVVDTRPPVLAPQADLTAEATSAKGAVVGYQTSAVDAVDGRVTPRCSPAPGSTFPIGATRVACTAADRRGNGTSSAFTITVVDTTPPALTLPAALTAEASSRKGAPVRYAVSAADRIDGPVEPSCSRLPGIFPLGTTSVTCTAADRRGNRASRAFTVTVVDTTGPAMRTPADVTLDARFEPTKKAYGAIVTYTVTAFDRVDGRIVPTCSIPSGTFVPVTQTTTRTVLCTAIDSGGNKTVRSFDVTIRYPDVVE
jgi:hypothetical protein